MAGAEVGALPPLHPPLEAVVEGVAAATATMLLLHE